MSIRSQLYQQVPGPIRRRVDARLERFRDWKRVRPFWGGFLLMIAGAVIGWIPIQFATELAIVGGVSTVIGLVFAVLVFLTGGFALSRPDMSKIFGVLGVAFSILSIIGALGGFGIGLILGVLGGNLCIAWEAPEGVTVGATGATTVEEGPTDEVQFSWQGEQ